MKKVRSPWAENQQKGKVWEFRLQLKVTTRAEVNHGTSVKCSGERIQELRVSRRY